MEFWYQCDEDNSAAAQHKAMTASFYLSEQQRAVVPRHGAPPNPCLLVSGDHQQPDREGVGTHLCIDSRTSFPIK